MRRRDEGAPARILLWQQNDAMGACEEYLVTLASGLAKEHPLWAVTLSVPEATASAFREKVERTVVVRAHKPGVIAEYRQIRDLRPDILHVNDPCLPALAAGRLLRVPSVLVTWHTPSLRITWNRRARTLLQYAIRNPRLDVITLSATNLHTYRTRYCPPAARVHVVEPGLDLSRFQTANASRSKTRPVSETLRLVTVARLAPQKDLATLLTALALAQQDTPRRLTLTIVGDGPDRAALEQTVHAYGLGDVITFLGWRSDIPDILAGHDVYVTSSLYEGFPFSVIEALAAGLPVIATAVDGLNDMITDTFGVLTPPASPTMLAQAICQVAMNPEWVADAGLNAAQYAAASFTASRMTEQTAALYLRQPRSARLVS